MKIVFDGNGNSKIWPKNNNSFKFVAVVDGDGVD